MKRHHGQGNTYKGQHLTGVAYNLRSLVHYHHGEKHGSVQAGMALEELKVLHLCLSQGFYSYTNIITKK